MTRRRRLKKLVRARAAKTGESYAAARRHFPTTDGEEPDMTTSTDESTDDGLRHCSFCGKSQKEVKKLVAGPGVYICNDCVALSVQIIAPTDEDKAELLSVDVTTTEGTSVPVALNDAILAFLNVRLDAIASANDLESLDAFVATSAFADSVRVNITTNRPGILIGRRGATLDELRAALSELAGRRVHINVIPSEGASTTEPST